ncbi:MAG: SdpI family protein [Chitinophagales bacterium]
MEKFDLKKELVLWLLCLVPVVYLAVSWGSAPDVVPTHFNIRGEVDNTGSKWNLLITPVANIIVYLLLLALPYLNPKRVTTMGSNFYKMRLSIGALLCAIGLLVINATLTGHLAGDGKWLSVILFLFFAVLGNFLISIKPNWFLGIRTPWTLSNDNVWKRTHLVGGRVWFFGGLAGFIVSLFLSAQLSVILLLAFTLTSAVGMIVYSFVLYRKEKQQLQ